MLLTGSQEDGPNDKGRPRDSAYPDQVSPYHSWQNIVDFGKRRYLYVYDMWGDMAVFDITDPAKPRRLVKKGVSWTADGPTKPVDPFPDAFDGFRAGASTMQWHRGLNKMLLIQSHENPRVGVLDDKTREPDAVQRLRRADHWKGFRIYEMKGPLPRDWVLLSETTTDYEHPNAKLGEQEGSGSLDVPVWNGGRYVIVAAAPNDRFSLTEYPDYLYSPGYQVWDIEDPVHPKFVSQIAVPGQIVGDLGVKDRQQWIGSSPSARQGFLRRQSGIVLDPVPRLQADRRLGRRRRLALGQSGFHVQPHLVIVDVSTGHEAGTPSLGTPPPYPIGLDHRRAGPKTGPQSPPGGQFRAKSPEFPPTENLSS